MRRGTSLAQVVWIVQLSWIPACTASSIGSIEPHDHRNVDYVSEEAEIQLERTFPWVDPQGGMAQFQPRNLTADQVRCEVHFCPLPPSHHCASSAPRGHLEPMGNQADAEPVPVVDAPNLPPAEFYSRFAAHRNPVLIRGAIASWPANTKWRNDTYLKQHCRHADGADWKTHIEVTRCKYYPICYLVRTDLYRQGGEAGSQQL